MKTIKPVLQVIALLILTVLSGSFLFVLFFGSYSVDIGKFFRYYDQKQKEVLLQEGKPVITIGLSPPSIRVEAAKIFRNQYRESEEKVVRGYYEVILPMPKPLTSEWFPDRLGRWKGIIYASKETGYIFPAGEYYESKPNNGWGWHNTDIITGWNVENPQIKCSDYLTWKQNPAGNNHLQKEE